MVSLARATPRIEDREGLVTPIYAFGVCGMQLLVPKDAAIAMEIVPGIKPASYS